MPFIMRGRNESVVYYEQDLEVSKTWEFMKTFSEKTGTKVTITHLLLWRAGQVLHMRPGLNRFVAGRRIYQRRGIWAVISMKKAMTEDSPDILMKYKLDPYWSLEDTVKAVQGGIDRGRSTQTSFTDLEMKILFSLPTAVVNAFARLLMKLDHYGWLPDFMLREDEMYASVAFANLGSIGLQPAFHHLYEYGNITIFAAIGKKAPRVMVGQNREPVVQDIMTIRYSFDERIHDGFYGIQALELFKHLVENPEEEVDLDGDRR